jgi:hypothetical protein
MSSVVHNHHITAPDDFPPEVLARVRAWLPRDFDWRVATKTEGDHWFALAMDFDIIGRGDTKDSAEDELFELLGAYLASYLVQDKPFEDAVRPVSKTLRLRIHVATVIYGLIDGLTKKPDRRQERAYESADLSPVAAAALCC